MARKLKISTDKEFKATKSYVAAPCVLEQEGRPIGELIHRVVLSDDDQELAVSKGSRISFYSIKNKPKYNHKNGTISFISYGTKYIIRAIAKSDAKWYMNKSASVQEIEEAYLNSESRLIISLPQKQQKEQNNESD